MMFFIIAFRTIMLYNIRIIGIRLIIAMRRREWYSNAYWWMNSRVIPKIITKRNLHVYKSRLCRCDYYTDSNGKEDGGKLFGHDHRELEFVRTSK
jgi:hypothetical protein